MWIDVFRIVYWTIAIAAPFTAIPFVHFDVEDLDWLLTVIIVGWLAAASAFYWLILRFCVLFGNSREAEMELEDEYEMITLGLTERTKRKRRSGFFSRFSDY